MRLILWLAPSIWLALGVLSADRAIGAPSVSLQRPPARAQQPPAEQLPPAAPSAAPSSKVWIGRYAEYEEFLRTAVIDPTTVAGATQQHVFFKPGGLAAGAALKRDSYKLEIAGYKLDRVLKLDMVPPTVEVRYNSNMASLQLWVLNTRMLRQLNERNLGAPDPVKWNYQLHRAYAFEDLVANLDENEGSPIVDPQWNLIVLDHSRAFTNTLAQPYEIGKKLNQIDRSFFDRIKALDKATVKHAIGDLVDAGALDALFARRDNIVKAFEKLAAQYGANQVFTP